ncbi:hypothetical protein ARMGADRAFT_1085293 [Armillaria gallica]|uniref:Uncharacterized protein n=1 Tax=Armillaria gallica TaxID=47427 RepID=A0A2H3D9U3_ARMGA|nr:hypothetical protein ARMGADRAFT_1085293 [Armillaria gallica]
MSGSVRCGLLFETRLTSLPLLWKSPTPHIFLHLARDEDVLNERYPITRWLGAGFGTVGRRSNHSAVSVEYKTLLSGACQQARRYSAPSFPAASCRPALSSHTKKAVLERALPRQRPETSALAYPRRPFRLPPPKRTPSLPVKVLDAIRNFFSTAQTVLYGDLDMRDIPSQAAQSSAFPAPALS